MINKIYMVGIKNFFIFNLVLFSVCQAQAVVFNTEKQGLESKNEVTHPFLKWEMPIPYDAKVNQLALLLLEQKNEELSKHYRALKIFYNLNVTQISEILNGQRLLLLYSEATKQKAFIEAKELESLYQKPDTRYIIEFILTRELSSKQTLIFLLPFLRENSLEQIQIIKILNSTNYNPNTVIQMVDIIEAVLTGDKGLEGGILSPEQVLNIENPNQGFSSSNDIINGFLKELKQYTQESDIAAQLFEEPQESSLKLPKKSKTETFFDPEIVITSLAHIAASNRYLQLIEYFYQNKSFKPNLLNHSQQTPFHSLFIENHSLKYSNSMSEKDWSQILSVIFQNKQTDINPKDIHGLTPFLIAVSNGHQSALPVLSDNKEIDLYAVDNYRRSSLILSARSLSKNKKPIIDFLIKKGGGNSLSRVILMII